jgi:hypothetical protein
MYIICDMIVTTMSAISIGIALVVGIVVFSSFPIVPHQSRSGGRAKDCHLGVRGKVQRLRWVDLPPLTAASFRGCGLLLLLLPTFRHIK